MEHTIWYRVTRYPQGFRKLMVDKWIPGFWAVIEYLWTKAVYEFMISCLNDVKCSINKRKAMCAIRLKGCAIELQVYKLTFFFLQLIIIGEVSFSIFI